MGVNFSFKLNIKYSLDNDSYIYWKKIFISLDKVTNVQFAKF